MYQRFIPFYLMRHGSAWAPAAARALETKGAVLIADIVGYTALTERASKAASSRGVEDLTLTLRKVFNLIEQAVFARGGDILTFAGDSVIAFWPIDERHSMVNSVRGAAAAALAVNESVARFAQSYPEASLRIRAGLAASDVTLYLVGGYEDDWRFFAAGPAIQEASRGLHIAAESTIACAPGVSALLKQVTGSPAAAGYVRWGLGTKWSGAQQEVQAAPASRSAVLCASDQRRFVPEVMRSYLDAGHEEWLSEFRRVTTAFVGLRGGAASVPAVQSLHDAVAQIQAAVRGLDGAVTRVSCDDKGIHALCAWGVPGRMHEDDEVRALTFALALRTSLTAQGLVFDIGVTTGKVLCSLSGGTERCEYTVSGEHVNLAAHIMAQAHARVLCDSATAYAARGAFRFERVESEFPKVSPNHTAIWSAGPLSADDDRSYLVLGFAGRETELQTLLAPLHALAGGRQGTLAVIGGEGVGKSTLVASALARVNHPRVISGQASEVEARTAYFAWRRVVLELVKLNSDAPTASIGARLRHVCADAAPFSVWLPVLNDVLSCGLTENDVTRRMSTGARADSIAAIIGHLLDTACEPSAVLVMEDVHWLDSASWRLLARVQSDPRPLLMVLVARDAELAMASDDHKRVFAYPGVTFLTLGALSRPETAALICRSLGVVSLDDRILDLIYSRTEGHPLFAAEAVKSLQQTGRIELEAGHARLAMDVPQSVASMIPESVEKLITTRFDRLPLPHQRTLHIASVLGLEFTIDALVGIQSDPVGGDVEKHLWMAQALGIVRRAAVGSGSLTQYSFCHAIIRNAVYALPSPSHLRGLHQRVAVWLEKAYAQAPNEVYPRLAHHWSNTDNKGRTALYLSLAGEQSLLRHAYREAVEFLSRASDIFNSYPSLVSPEALTAHQRLLGHGWLGLGELGKARSHLEASFGVDSGGIPASRYGLATGAARQCLVQITRRLKGAPACADLQPTTASWKSDSHALFRLGHIAWFQSDIRTLVYVALRGLNLAERVGTRLEMACLCAGMATIVGAAGLRRIATAYLGYAFEIADHRGDPQAAAEVGFFAALYLAGIGEWESALVQSLRSIELNEQLGDNRHLDECSVTAAYIHFHLGEYSEADGFFRACLRRGRGRGDKQTTCWGLLGVSRINLMRGELAGAEAALEAAESMVVDRLSAIELHGQRSLVQLHQAAYQRSAQEATIALELITQTRPLSFSTLIGIASVAQVFLALFARAREYGDATEAARFNHSATAALAALRQFSRVFPIGLPLSKLLNGHSFFLQGRHNQAKRSWQVSSVVATKLKMPFEQAASNSTLRQHELLMASRAGMPEASRGGANQGDALSESETADIVVWPLVFSGVSRTEAAIIS